MPVPLYDSLLPMRWRALVEKHYVSIYDFISNYLNEKKARSTGEEKAFLEKTEFKNSILKKFLTEKPESSDTHTRFTNELLGLIIQTAIQIFTDNLDSSDFTKISLKTKLCNHFNENEVDVRRSIKAAMGPLLEKQNYHSSSPKAGSFFSKHCNSSQLFCMKNTTFSDDLDSAHLVEMLNITLIELILSSIDLETNEEYLVFDKLTDIFAAGGENYHNTIKALQELLRHAQTSGTAEIKAIAQNQSIASSSKHTPAKDPQGYASFIAALAGNERAFSTIWEQQAEIFADDKNLSAKLLLAALYGGNAAILAIIKPCLVNHSCPNTSRSPAP